MLQKSLNILCVIWGFALFITGVLAYMVTSYDPVTKAATDGLGRTLTQTPALAKIFFGQHSTWTGWGWFAGDMIIFWGSVAIIMNLADWSDKRGKR